jgi:peptidase YpeB-like protein
MRNRNTSIAVLALTLGCLALPAAAGAQVVLSQQISMMEARDIAAENGVVAIREIEFFDGKWQIWGKDQSAQNVKIEINGQTGMIEWLSRD